MARFSKVLLFAVLLVTALAFALPAFASSPNLTIMFDKPTYEPGEIATVTVQIDYWPDLDLGELPLESATVDLQYDSTAFADPDLSDTTAIVAGGVMDTPDTKVLAQQKPGHISLNAALPGGAATGTGTLFTFQLPVRASAADDYTFVEFMPMSEFTQPDGVQLLDTASPAGTIPLGMLDDLTYGAEIFLGATITGTITLDDAAPGASLAGTAVTLTFVGSGYNGPASILAEGQLPLTDAAGHFSLGGLYPGTYDLHAARPGYLSKTIHGVTLVRGANKDISNLGLSLVPGNIMDTSFSEDTVFLEDLAGLARSFNTADPLLTPTVVSPIAWNDAADLDRNSSVGAADLGLLAQNWGRRGAESLYHDMWAHDPDMVINLNPIQTAGSMTLTVNPTQVQYTDVVTMTATLSIPGATNLAYKVVQFNLGGIFGRSATDGNGVATITLPAWLASGTYTVGAQSYEDPETMPLSATAPLTVSPESATLAYHGGTAMNYDSLYLKATVQQENDGFFGMVTEVGVDFIVTDLSTNISETISAYPDQMGNASYEYWGTPYTRYSVQVALPPNPYFTAEPVTVNIHTDSMIALDGPISTFTGDTETFTANLMPATAGKSISFHIEDSGYNHMGNPVSANTDASGMATVTLTMPTTPGDYYVVADFPAGDPDQGPTFQYYYVTVDSPPPVPTMINLTLSSNTALPGDQVTATADYDVVTNGTFTFSLIDPSSTSTSLGQEPNYGAGASVTIDTSNLTPGSYTVLVTDGTLTGEAYLEIQQPAPAAQQIYNVTSLDASMQTSTTFMVGDAVYIQVENTTAVAHTISVTYNSGGSSTPIASNIPIGANEVLTTPVWYPDSTLTYTIDVSDENSDYGTTTIGVTNPL